MLTVPWSPMPQGSLTQPGCDDGVPGSPAPSPVHQQPEFAVLSLGHTPSFLGKTGQN